MKYDVVIVGGGAAGSVLAGRLAANPQTSVLLLEAGPDYPDPAMIPDDIKFGHTRFAEALDSRHNWALHGTITEEQGEIHVAQGKVIGGGSSINGQAMQRGFPEDFDSWAALGNDEWSYEKVVPYFRKSERDLVDTAQNITALIRIHTGAQVALPVRPGDAISATLCLQTNPAGTAFYGLANETTSQTVSFTIDTGFPPAVTINAGVTRDSQLNRPPDPLARFGVVYFDELVAFTPNGNRSLLDGIPTTMTDSNG